MQDRVVGLQEAGPQGRDDLRRGLGGTHLGLGLEVSEEEVRGAGLPFVIRRSVDKKGHRDEVDPHFPCHLGGDAAVGVGNDGCFHGALPFRAAFPQQIFGALVTEKVRSLGAKLVNRDGKVFMHPLETRDVAAASIIRECSDRADGVDTGSGDAVWLDTPMIEAIGGEGTIERRIPAMMRMYMSYGIDIRRVESTQDLFDAVTTTAPDMDVVIQAAAPADYRFAVTYPQKHKKAHDGQPLVVELVENPDIAAAVGLKNTTTGDTLCDEKYPIVLESMEFPEPVIRVAIEPKTKAGQEKMDIALGKLAEEDPTFKAYTDEETGQTIIAGMGELHLEIIVDRLLREFRVEANVGRPQVSYKETITKAATVDTRYARQTGGKGQFAHVKLMVEPNEPGKGYEFINQITGGAIPKEFIPCVDQGIQGAMQAGVLAGYEVVDVKVTLLDGSYHEVDSSEMAFKICGSMAFKEACQKAGPTLLEPIMKVVVTAPESYMGDVMGDINARRGQIAGTDIRNGAAIVTANVPLASMFGYATDLRSKTQGRATYSMEPSHFVELPKSLQEKIIHGSN